MQRLTRKVDWADFVGPVDIPLLADEGVTSEPGLKADLVAFAGNQTHFNQRRGIETIDDAIIADGVFARCGSDV